MNIERKAKALRKKVRNMGCTSGDMWRLINIFDELLTALSEPCKEQEQKTICKYCNLGSDLHAEHCPNNSNKEQTSRDKTNQLLIDFVSDFNKLEKKPLKTSKSYRDFCCEYVALINSGYIKQSTPVASNQPLYDLQDRIDQLETPDTEQETDDDYCAYQSACQHVIEAGKQVSEQTRECLNCGKAFVPYASHWLYCNECPTLSVRKLKQETPDTVIPLAHINGFIDPDTVTSDALECKKCETVYGSMYECCPACGCKEYTNQSAVLRDIVDTVTSEEAYIKHCTVCGERYETTKFHIYKCSKCQDTPPVTSEEIDKVMNENCGTYVDENGDWTDIKSEREAVEIIKRRKKLETPDTVTSEDIYRPDSIKILLEDAEPDTTEHDTPIDPIEQAREYRPTIEEQWHTYSGEHVIDMVELYEQAITYRDKQIKNMGNKQIETRTKLNNAIFKYKKAKKVISDLKKFIQALQETYKITPNLVLNKITELQEGNSK